MENGSVEGAMSGGEGESRRCKKGNGAGAGPSRPMGQSVRSFQRAGYLVEPGEPIAHSGVGFFAKGSKFRSNGL